MQSQGQAEALGTESDHINSHIRLTAVNIHHLCNEWRPVQAREILKQIMRAQIEDRKKRTFELSECVSVVSDIHVRVLNCGSRACLQMQNKLKNLKTRLDPIASADLAKGLLNLGIRQKGEPRLSLDPTVEESKAQDKALAREKMLQALDAI